MSLNVSTSPAKFQQLTQTQHQQTKIAQNHAVFQKHYGCCFILSRYQNGQPKYTLGPHYYIFIIAFLTLTILLIMLIVTMKDHLTTFWLAVIIACGILFIISYLNIGLSVPGFASRVEEPSQEDKLNPRYCKPCKTIRTNRVYHCFDCDVCIQDYDHHCPWIGKCVGGQNLKSFYFFLVMTFGTLIMCFVATVGSSPSLQTKQLRTNDDNNSKFTVKG